MSGNTSRSSARHPHLLRVRIAQAEHLARALRAVSAKAPESDPSFVWLLGRADEVRTLVDEVVRECSIGAIDATQACEAIRSYVDAVHVALHRRYGGFGASCCGPHLEPFERVGATSAQDEKTRRRFDSGVQEIAREDSASRAPRKQFSTTPPQRKSAS
jgi:hypothetical protein